MSSGRAVYGAALVSSLGTLPLHLMPFVVATVVLSGKLPVQFAGVVTSVYWIGILFTTLLMPLVASRVTARGAALCALMVPSLAVASTLLNGYAFVAVWLLLGGACGVLSFAGSTFAATTRIPAQVFALRLGCVLLAATTALLLATFVFGTTTYSGAASSIVLVSLVVAVAGAWLYREPNAPLPARPTLGTTSNGQVPWRLVLVVLFFAGQPGFLAYAAHAAIERGLDPQHLYLTFGLGKLAGVVALYSMRSRSSTANVALLSSTVALGIGFISHASALWLFGLGLLLWEVAINPLSARLQGAAVEQAPSIAGRWLPAAVGIGACLGPTVHGAALQTGAGALFLYYSIASAFLPLLLMVTLRPAPAD